MSVIPEAIGIIHRFRGECPAFALLHAPAPPALGEDTTPDANSSEEVGPEGHGIYSCVPSPAVEFAA
jgi:hypothetical protein